MQTMPGAERMENIWQSLERGFTGGVFIAATFTGFAGFLYLLYQLIMFMRPKKVRQEEKQILTHRFYQTSWRGRIAYLILCLEETLQFYKQDLTAWEWILRKLWSITDNSEGNWIDVWLDSIEELLPSTVLTNTTAETTSEERSKAQNLYTQAGIAMIVINTILENAYSIVCEWSPYTEAYDPDALYHIDKVEETLKAFGVPLPSNKIVQLLLEQKDYLFGETFDGLRFSCLSKRE